MQANKMQTDKILDDVARVAGSAMGALGGLRRQIKDEVRSRIDELAQKLDLVPREDFERVELMMFKAREEQTKLAERLTALEAQISNSNKKKPPENKTAAKKPATRKKA